MGGVAMRLLQNRALTCDHYVYNRSFQNWATQIFDKLMKKEFTLEVKVM